ncbi:hypothetical protein CORC01_02475, partial [Colletotrichum orchidophilum]
LGRACLDSGCLDASLVQVGYGLAPRGCYYRLAVSCSTQVNRRPFRSVILFWRHEDEVPGSRAVLLPRGRRTQGVSDEVWHRSKWPQA